MTADGQRGSDGGRLVDRPTATLRPHPTYQALCSPIAATRVRRVAQQPGPIREPLLTTSEGTILDGHARWQVALDRQQPSLPCIEYDVTKDEALQIVIQHHRASEGLKRLLQNRDGLGSGALPQRAQPSTAACGRRQEAAVKLDERRASGRAEGHRARGGRLDRQCDQSEATPEHRDSGDSGTAAVGARSVSIGPGSGAR